MTQSVHFMLDLIFLFGSSRWDGSNIGEYCRRTMAWLNCIWLWIKLWTAQLKQRRWWRNSQMATIAHSLAVEWEKCSCAFALVFGVKFFFHTHIYFNFFFFLSKIFIFYRFFGWNQLILPSFVSISLLLYVFFLLFILYFA